jgi:hypothetical protein
MIDQARNIFEQLLEMSLGSRRTEGACFHAVILCQTLIQRFSPFRPKIKGGDGHGDGGLWIEGLCHGHYWIEIDVSGERYIVDITADQFGQERVIFAPAKSLSIRYEAGDQDTVDGHVLHEISNFPKNPA